VTARTVQIQTGRGEGDLRFYVKDQTSGVLLAGFVLSPEQIWRMLGGGQIDIEATTTNHFERVGKTMVTESVVYDRNDLKASTYDQMEADAEQLARADRPGWDEYSARRLGGGLGGIRVVMRRWE
jgi:hypothetical protein